MNIPEIITASSLIVLALAHSALGETGILRPLFAADWKTAETPRWAMQKILRFAWHLTSITWLALALIVLGVELLPVVGVMNLVSAGLIFVMLRGHLAWPIFLVGGLAAFHGAQPLPEPLLMIAAIATIASLIAAAGLHVWWAAGGTGGLNSVLPTDPNRDQSSQFTPGPVPTMIVAISLAALAALVAMTAFGIGPSASRWPVVAATIILGLRAVGDNKLVGFTKQVRTTEFAAADDRLFTPLCVFLALGTTASLLL